MVMPLPDGAPRFKGVVLRELAPWLVRSFSYAVVQRAFATLPAGLASGLDPTRPDFGALAGTWYDARIYKIVLDVVLASKPGVSRKALAREAAESMLGTTLRGIYSGLFRLMATPALYARYAQKMWDTHYDTGTVAIGHASATEARHEVRGWAGHHPFVCELNRQSGAVVYELMGVRDVRIIAESCSPPACTSTYRWSP